VCGILAMLFIAVPAVEIYLLITVGTEIGALATMGIIITTGVCGAALARHQGLSAMRGLARATAGESSIGRAGVEAALVLVAGVLLLTPGFVTDGVGFALLMPPVRRLATGWIIARYARRAARVVFMGDGRGFPDLRGPDARVHDARSGRGAGVADDDYDPPPPGVIDV
jgi:UPF0716 protein FxsA